MAELGLRDLRLAQGAVGLFLEPAGDAGPAEDMETGDEDLGFGVLFGADLALELVEKFGGFLNVHDEFNY